MVALFIGTLLLIAFGALGLQFFLKLRTLQSARTLATTVVAAERYRPMLRLLSDDDLAFVSGNGKLRQSLRTRRRELFRGYLRCLTRDYAGLLAGLRLAIVQSGADRPDLFRALAKNRMLFALAICKIEFLLAIHAAGVGKVEIAGLVEAIEVLRSQVQVLSNAPTLA